MRKKSKCPKENFQSVEKGEKKNVSVEFRVFRKKMKLKEKFRKENQSILGGNFAKFVFTGWAFMLICKLQTRKNFGCWFTPLVGRHVD